jgi:rod shape-determining protein MreC
MENFFSRYKNPLVLMLVLFIQVVGLATQVKRSESAKPSSGGGPRLIRVWTVTIITPFEKAFSGTGHFFRRTWRNYIDLHDARKENQELQEQLARMKMEQARLQEDAQQAKRLQVLMDFKERYIGQTVAAQVVGTSGSEQSRLLYIDKGSHSGIKQDMPVITPDGIVGKIKEVFPFTSQVLLVNDHDSGAGVVMQNSRLQGILRGTAQGQLIITGVMSDEKIEAGERIVTSGGDRIYPKGVPVGTVVRSVPDVENDPFLKITVKPAANLDKLEEVLVVTRMAETAPTVTAGPVPQRAADILAQRLPSAKQPETATGDKTPAATPTPAPVGRPTPPLSTTGDKKPGTAGASPSVEKKTAGASPSAEKKTAGTSPGQNGVTQRKSTAGVAGASPAATPGPNTATPGPKKPLAVQNRGQGTGSAAPSGTASGAGATANATPGAATQGTKKSAAAAGTPVTGGNGATKKTKASVKPKLDAAPPDGGAQATPAGTPERKKPEPPSQPTPSSSGEKPPK